MKNNILGLTEEEVKNSREKYGDNSLVERKRKGFLLRFLENLFDPIIRILMIALVIQVIFSFGNINYFEILGILFAILLSTTVSTVSEYRSERAFDRLKEESLVRIRVNRNKRLITILSDEIVVGDIVYLSAGEKIPCDGVMLEGELVVDQSALNGESNEIHKSPCKTVSFDLNERGRVFRGSIVTEGAGIIRCERVGVKTFYGMVANDVQSETRESPLKLRLGRLAYQISRLGYLIATIVGFSFLFNAFVVDNSFSPTLIAESLRDTRFLVTTLIRALTLMITVVVVAAPEGLPMMITVVLSANMKKMLNDNILVKKLVGIETAGSMNILFTDKTGTLTEGKPRIDRIVTASGCYKTVGQIKNHGQLYKLLSLNARYNNDIVFSDGIATGGNSTDKAIFEFFGQTDFSDTVKNKISFTSERKFSSVTLSSGIRLIKGAPEVVLSSAKRALGSDGGLTDINHSALIGEYHSAMKKGERVLAVGYSPEDSSDTVLLALIVMKDKIRKGVEQAVREVKGAGVQIVMITGDSLLTASTIAAEAGIYSKELGHIALDSEILHKMDDKSLKEIIPKLRVVARALPQDKTRLVRLSQELELVVGMTGDGINDAPSLKLCDVGFAMGSGADIAKSASDIVILDNSFTAISKTILYGRTIFKSIRKFITFQLIMNLAASGISLIGQFAGIETPITIIQMLWVNIIMDTLGGIAFAGEAPLIYYMKEKTKRRDEPIINRQMLTHIIISGSYTLALCTAFLTLDFFKQIYPTEGKLYTAFYALFIFSGIFNCFLARCERLNLLSNIGKNKIFVFIMMLISAIQIFMIYYGGEVFRCVPLSYKELSFVIFLAFTVIPFDIIRRIVYKLK